MLLINMRIFKTVLLIASLSASVRCLPIGDGSTELRSKTRPSFDVRSTTVTATTPERSDIDHYDQRQTGKQNYRVHVDGLVFMIAPYEALYLNGATAGATTTQPNLSIDHGGFAQTGSGEQTIDIPAIGLHNNTETAISKMIPRSALRLANLLTPLFRHVHHERSSNVR